MLNGTIIIDTQIDTKGVDAGSEKTEASLWRMAQKVNDIGATAKAALNKQIDAFARLNSQYDSQSEKIDALKRKIAGYSDEYGEMQAKIDETVKKLNDLEMMQGLILQFEQINYVLHKIDEATCETGKGVDDAWNMLKNREGIWQGANIVQTYMSSFEKNIADVIELIDTEDITGYIPAEKTDRA